MNSFPPLTGSLKGAGSRHGTRTKDIHRGSMLRVGHVHYRPVRDPVYFSQLFRTITNQTSWTTLAAIGSGVGQLPYPATPSFIYRTTTTNQSGMTLQLRIRGLDAVGNQITEETPVVVMGIRAGGTIISTTTPANHIGWVSKCFSRVDSIEYKASNLPAASSLAVGLVTHCDILTALAPPNTLFLGHSAGANEKTQVIDSPNGVDNNMDLFWNQGFALPIECQQLAFSDAASVSNVAFRGNGAIDVISGYLNNLTTGFLAPAGAYQRGNNNPVAVPEGGFVINQNGTLDDWNGDPNKIMLFHSSASRKLLQTEDALLASEASRVNAHAEAWLDKIEIHVRVRSSLGYFGDFPPILQDLKTTGGTV